MQKLLETEEKEKIRMFEVIPGGKEPPSTDVTWLEKLPNGTCFLAKEKNNPLDFLLRLFRIASRTERGVVLQTPEHPTHLYVDPVPFCNKYRLFENMGTINSKEEEENERNRIETNTGIQTKEMERPIGE